ncbi:hypothetical protein Cpir12675_004493 [Ceratocystis pirilliformis]|uniref:Uncharacterized protein n=1 Tax=Ceratocystis pirilliformis TaxID=259994 RepID=A0ABR3YZ24_9PEZI
MVSSSTQTDPMINTETVQSQAVSSLANGLQQLQSTKPQQLPPLVEPQGTDSKPTPAQDASSQCIQLRGMQLQSAHPIQQHAHSPQNLRDRQLSPKFPSRVPVSPKLQTCSDSSKRSVCSSAFSNNFLEHYLHMTTEILVSNTKAENPFLQYVMPLAHSDDSLMEAVLCLGGTHLCASMETPDPAVRKATLGLAFRSILISLQDEMPSSFDSIEEKLQGSMLEIYSYLVLVANITPYGLDENRTLPFDSFLFSFGERVAGLDSSGVIFSSIDGLFSLIPSVSLLARQRLEEPDNSPSAGLMRKFTELEQRINGWEPPADTAVVWDADRDSLASVYRHALLVYLKTARCGAVVGDVRVIQDVQEHVNSAIATMMSLAMSTMCAVLLWPVMIVGSCLIVKPQQNMVYEGLRYSRYKTANVLQAIELLEKLWRDPAPEAYGPYGLHYVMKKTGISLCMS